MSTFRASPWVSYYDSTSSQPSSSKNMDESVAGDAGNDVDMDAPQISTLRDEDSPPPQKRRAAKTSRNDPFYVQQLKQQKAAAVAAAAAAAASEEDFDAEPEEEEDQLIDDDDDDVSKPPLGPTIILPPSGRSTDTAQKKKPAAKPKKPKKIEKKDSEKKVKDKVSNPPPDVSTLAPTMSWFEATPSESYEEAGRSETIQISLGGTPIESASAKALGKKKASPRKPAAVVPRNPKAKVPKQKTAIPPQLIAEDVGVLSEAYTGTAASSPVTGHYDLGSPEPENEENIPPDDDTNLEGVAIPVYPLPTRPFPVQPPPKIGSSGVVAMLPLERTGIKVRRWRTARREIRGIAGGRWFANSWVGEKESDYAVSIAAIATKGGEDKGGVVIPKLPSVSISAPGLGKLGAKPKGSKAPSSLAASAAPSRASSVGPEGVATMANTPRAPTKMRTFVAPPSEGGDSDMAPPPDL